MDQKRNNQRDVHNNSAMTSGQLRSAPADKIIGISGICWLGLIASTEYSCAEKTLDDLKILNGREPMVILPPVILERALIEQHCMAAKNHGAPNVSFDPPVRQRCELDTINISR